MMGGVGQNLGGTAIGRACCGSSFLALPESRSVRQAQGRLFASRRMTNSKSYADAGWRRKTDRGGNAFSGLWLEVVGLAPPCEDAPPDRSASGSTGCAIVSALQEWSTFSSNRRSP